MAEYYEWLFVLMTWLGAYLREQSYCLSVVQYLYVN